MSFDTKCFDLAELFLEDAPDGCIVTEGVRRNLAQHIQDTIENFLQDADNFPHPELRFDTHRERDEWRHEAADWQRIK